MKKSFSLLIALCFVISCGGGGGGGSSPPPPPPPDNFGSIMTAAPESAPGLVKEERESTEEFWTEERILEAVKNPIKMEEPTDTKIEISPQEKTTRQIQEGVPESFPPHNPDADNKSKLINKKLNYKADQSRASEATSSCPQLSYQMYSGRGYQEYPEKTIGSLFFQKKEACIPVVHHSSISA